MKNGTRSICNVDRIPIQKINNITGKYSQYFPNLGELTPNQKNRGLVLPMQRKHSELIALP